ncbi:hypothetical protein [Streptomyces globisporus]|nr:hypothetical protein [Streptomyces globisporus]
MGTPAQAGPKGPSVVIASSAGVLVSVFASFPAAAVGAGADSAP